MKEIIAKRSKSNFWIMLGICLLAVAICVVGLLTQQNLQVVYIIGLCVFGAAAIACLVMIILPSSAIELREKQLVVRIGLFKKVGVKLTQITDVCLMPDTQNPKEVLGDALIIRYVARKKHGQIDCAGIINAPEAVEKIKGLMK